MFPITLTVLLPQFVTYARVPWGLKATRREFVPTVIVLTTVLEATLITLTVPLPAFVTYARVPWGLKATPSGPEPTVIVLTTVLEATLITLTVPLPRFATYARVPWGLKATPVGSAPTVIVLTTWLFTWLLLRKAHCPVYGPVVPPLIRVLIVVAWPTSIKLPGVNMPLLGPAVSAVAPALLAPAMPMNWAARKRVSNAMTAYIVRFTAPLVS